jgi:hypothetical protein
MNPFPLSIPGLSAKGGPAFGGHTDRMSLAPISSPKLLRRKREKEFYES